MHPFVSARILNNADWFCYSAGALIGFISLLRRPAIARSELLHGTAWIGALISGGYLVMSLAALGSNLKYFGLSGRG